MTYLVIGLGSFLGGIARYWLTGIISVSFGTTFPWGTLLVNMIGSFIIGFLATIFSPAGLLLVDPQLRQFFMIGICGGFTTFSSFSLETLYLVQENEWLKAGLNIISSVIICLVAVWLGHIFANLINDFKENL